MAKKPSPTKVAARTRKTTPSKVRTKRTETPEAVAAQTIVPPSIGQANTPDPVLEHFISIGLVKKLQQPINLASAVVESPVKSSQTLNSADVMAISANFARLMSKPYYQRRRKPVFAGGTPPKPSRDIVEYTQVELPFVTRLRKAIRACRKDAKGRDAPYKVVCESAVMGHDPGLPLLRKMEKNGEYNGFVRKQRRTRTRRPS